MNQCNPLKVYQVNHSDCSGGAARAAYRLHQALRAQAVDSSMIVNAALTDDWTVYGPSGKFKKLVTRARNPLAASIRRLLKTSNSIVHSPALFPSFWPKKLNNSDADLINLHWINAEMMSISDIGRIKKPVVWTLHDMWAFRGAEHVADDFRWYEGYTANNRPSYERGFDLNRWVWNRKRRAWKTPIQMITPSSWLTECVRTSKLMHGWPVSTIHNAINTNEWKPIEKVLARQIMNLPIDVPIIAFGAIGVDQWHKGYDLLQEALLHLHGEVAGLNLIVFGQMKPRTPPKLGFPIHYVGQLRDDLSLRVLYSAIDAMVVPSRQESFGQTASESFACATPVVAFGATGLLDIVDHKVNGYLAKPFEPEDLASGIKWILEYPQFSQLSGAARKKAVEKFDSCVIANQYINLYEKVLMQGC